VSTGKAKRVTAAELLGPAGSSNKTKKCKKKGDDDEDEEDLEEDTVRYDCAESS
jgi:hypothetical protein